MSSSEPWRNPRPAPPLAEIRTRVPVTSMIPSWLRAWWPALLWCCVIFTASTDTFSAHHTGSWLAVILRWFLPNLSANQFEHIHHFVRKSAHVIEYFILYLLLFRGFRGDHRGWRLSWASAAMGIAAIYAVLDETHQLFVASRGPSGWDSLLDSAGAFVALVAVFLYFRFFRSHRST